MASARRRRRRRSGRSSGRYRSPGVYVEEVPSGARPIEGVGTSVAAFVGMARRAPLRTAAGILVLAAVTVAAVRALGRIRVYD